MTRPNPPYDPKWLAGVLDANGRFFATSNSSRVIRPCVTVTSINPKLIELLWRTTKAGIDTTTTQCNSRVWRVYVAAELEPILRHVIPHMRVQRRQAQLLLELCELTVKRGQRLTDAHVELRRAILEELRSLSPLAEKRRRAKA